MENEDVIDAGLALIEEAGGLGTLCAGYVEIP